jgi:hypothetical protein
MSRLRYVRFFGVDAVLPADVGGAPSASRQHNKVSSAWGLVELNDGHPWTTIRSALQIQRLPD